MRPLLAILVALALSACGDNSVQVINNPPEVTILQPPEGTAVPAGVPLTVIARVADDQSTSDELDLVLSSDREGDLEATWTWSSSRKTSVSGHCVVMGEV